MYTVYVDDKLLYAPTLVHEGHAILNPKLTLELNKAGSFTFLLPPNNVLYDSIQKLKSVVTVLQDGEEIFRGRVLHDTRDFYNRKDVYCEGELSFLIDSVQRPFSLTGSFSDIFAQIVGVHNEQVDEYKRFTVGIIDDFYSGEIDSSLVTTSASSTDYTNTLDIITTKFINFWGGYLRIRVENGVRYLDYVKEYGAPIDQTIEFGVNLLDISEYISADEIFTVLVPLGTNKNSSSSNDGSPGLPTIPKCETDDIYMSYEGEGKYVCPICGEVVNRNVDSGTGGNVNGVITIENASDLSILPQGIKKVEDHLEDEAAIALFGRIWKVQKWDDIDNADKLMQAGLEHLQASIEMAVSLTVKAVDLHYLNVDTGRIRLGCRVRVISPPHKLDKEFLCSKITIDLVSPDKTEYDLGATYKTFTETQVSDGRTVQNAVNTVQQTTQNVVNQVNEKMTAESIFRILTNNGEVKGIIRDAETGDIYINASYIKSGTLTLGGENALMQVLDADGVVRARIDDDGIHILDGEVVATSGSLENMTIVNGITISSKNDPNARDMSLVSIEKVTSADYGTYYQIAFGESTNKTTPMAFYGSTIEFSAPSGLTFTSDNIIFNGPVEVSDIYVNKKWTPLTLINGFENKNFEAARLEYRAIGKHVYIRGSVKFPDNVAWNGSTAQVTTLPSLIRPKYNHYEIKACSGARIARIFASANGAFSLEWIRLLSNGANDTSGTGLWISMNMDYWID